jgi:hypothetical protein
MPEESEQESELKEPEKAALPEIEPPPYLPQAPTSGRSSPLKASIVSISDSKHLDGPLEPPVLFSPFQTSSIDGSPEGDLPVTNKLRLRRPIGRAELNNIDLSFDASSIMSSSQRSMRPPQTPASSSGNIHKRRRSDVIHSDDMLPPSKRNRGSSMSNTDASSGPIGITRRGRFKRDGKDLTGSFKGPATPDTKPQLSSAKILSIRRIVIKNQGEVFIDQKLTTPLSLFYKGLVPEVAVIPSSPVYPLPESVVFGTPSVSNILTPGIMRTPTPTPTFQAPTPQPSSSPTRRPRQSGSSSPRKKSQTPIGQHSYAAKRVRHRDPTEHVNELSAAWKTPELSKDCVVSFAEDGPWRTSVNGKGGVWRQIRSARPGYFKESEVLFGVRYLIG